MKRLLVTSLTTLTVLTGIFYFQFSEGKKWNPTISDQATVARVPVIQIPDHIQWIDSLYENSSAGSNHTIYNIASGDTFYKILSKMGLDRKVANQLSSLAGRKFSVTGFKIGQEIKVFRTKGKPYRLEYPLSPTSSLEIDIKNLSVNITEKEVITRVHTFHSNVVTSIASTLSQKDIPTDLSDKLLSIFAWDIDFMKLQKEDIFGIVYEEQSADGEVIGSGKILSAYIIHEGKKFEAFYFSNDSVRGYFDANGINYSHAPLEFDLITSLYKKRRFHPVKRRYRAHLGMDFMAEEGTPIESLKDGTVIAAGYRRANGNYVKIKHDQIITQYLHLSEIAPGIKTGSKVKRGEVIGKVGSTGLSSGPHLCLRVWQNGKQKDPLKFDFERREDIPVSAIEDFRQNRDRQLEMLY